MSAEAAQVVDAKDLKQHQKVLDTPNPNKFMKCQYQLAERIGSGSFGVVYTAMDTLQEGRIVAIKCIQNEDKERMCLSEEMKREMQALKRLNNPGHENVLHSLDKFVRKHEGYIFIVMPYYPYGDLYEYLPMLKSMDKERKNKQIEKWTGQLVHALEYIHGKGVCHRDFKSSNILVNKETDRLVVGDFGCSRSDTRGTRGKFFSSEGVFTIAYRCTRFLLQPEKTDPFSVDVWSLACVVGDMITGRLFFGDTHTEDGTLLAHFRFLGVPTEEYWPGVTKLKNWKRDFPVYPLVPVEELRWWKANGVTGPVLAVLAKAMVMNPDKRGSARDLVLAFEAAVKA